MDPAKPRSPFWGWMLFWLIACVLTVALIYPMHLGWYHEPHSNHHLLCGLVLLAASGAFWVGVVCTLWAWTTNESSGAKLLITGVLLVTCGPLSLALGFLFVLLHLAP